MAVLKHAAALRSGRSGHGKFLLGSLLCAAVLLCTRTQPARGAGVPDFKFGRDTFAFANETVFEYREGRAQLRKASTDDKAKADAYTRRCFVMSRAAAQFHKFVRFDPAAAPLDDRALAQRVRRIARQRPWQHAWPVERRVVIPGYANLRALSAARGRVLQDHLGVGWTTYVRLGNWRMFTHHSREYQVRTHAELESALAGGEFFVGYLSTFPKLSINHAVLFYAHRLSLPALSAAGPVDHYWVYDPNHPEAPRRLDYSASRQEFSFEKDTDFIGGFVRVYHVFGRAWQ